jgi:predicted DNA-binding antitoxin AbrB/MazE fold protein
MLTVEAIYENGVLRPVPPLPLEEGEKVILTVQPARSLARQTAGMIPRTGAVETLEHLAVNPEFGSREAP